MMMAEHVARESYTTPSTVSTVRSMCAPKARGGAYPAAPGVPALTHIGVVAGMTHAPPPAAATVRSRWAAINARGSTQMVEGGCAWGLDETCVAPMDTHPHQTGRQRYAYLSRSEGGLACETAGSWFRAGVPRARAAARVGPHRRTKPMAWRSGHGGASGSAGRLVYGPRGSRATRPRGCMGANDMCVV